MTETPKLMTRAGAIGCVSAIAMICATAANAVDLNLMMSNVDAKTTVLATGGRVKTIFGGAAGKNLPDEMRRGANGCMPACEFGDVLARLTEMWWAGDEAAARALHRRILPLINLENHALVRYILRRRGVISSTVERSPGGELDAEDKREISLLLAALEPDDFASDYPFGEE